MWCGPRTCSTSLMYGFHHRGDTTVFDEPLYAHHLRVCPELKRPYKAAVMAAQDNDGDAVVRDLIMANHGKPIVLAKHMAKQLVDMDHTFMTHPECVHVVLIRTPAGIINSYTKALGGCTVGDTCLPAQVEILRELEADGKTVHVVLSEDMQEQPESMMRGLCDATGIKFTDRMLTWPAGAKPEIDGVWADHWYATSHKSTGFGVGVAQNRPTTVPAGLEAVLEECNDLFAVLQKRVVIPSKL